MEYDPVMEALEEAYQLGEENENRMERGMKALDVDDELRKIKEKYFM